MSQVLITLPELAIAISQLPTCRQEMKNQIEIPIAVRKRENVYAYERPPVITFNKVTILRLFNDVEYRWALGEGHSILIG
jgi:hypothetical protein